MTMFDSILKTFDLERGEYYHVVDKKHKQDFIARYAGRGLFGTESFVSEVVVQGKTERDAVTDNIEINRSIQITRVPKNEVVKVEKLTSKGSPKAIEKWRNERRKKLKNDPGMLAFQETLWAKGPITYYRFERKGHVKP